MSVFLIALHEPNETVWRRLEDHWPNRHHRVSDRLALVAPEGIAVTSEIAELVGMNMEEKISGFVVLMDAYNGFGSPQTVEWLRNAS